MDDLEKTREVVLRDDCHPRGIYPTRAVARTLVGRGWWPLLGRAFDVVEAEDGAKILQIKEKFGALRVSPDHGMPEVAWQRIIDVLRVIRAESLTICEACGAPGELRKDLGWWTTLCDSCHARHEAGQTRRQIYGYQPYTTPIDHDDSP